MAIIPGMASEQARLVQQLVAELGERHRPAIERAIADALACGCQLACLELNRQLRGLQQKGPRPTLTA